MDELDIAGKQYISTRRAGREHGYHSDYIGQLIRGGKVKGQKVGRSWYVDAESLAIYLGKTVVAASEYAKTLDTIPEVKKETVEPVGESAPVAVIENKFEESVEEKVIEPVVETASEPEEKIIEEKVQPIVETASLVVEALPRAVPVQAASVDISAPMPVAEEKSEHSIGLRYITDDSPSLPAVQAMPQFEASGMAQAAVTFVPQKRNILALSVALISAVGIAVVIGVGMSMYVFGRVQVAGETANVYYAIEK